MSNVNSKSMDRAVSTVPPPARPPYPGIRPFTVADILGAGAELHRAHVLDGDAGAGVVASVGPEPDVQGSLLHGRRTLVVRAAIPRGGQVGQSHPHVGVVQAQHERRQWSARRP